MTFLKIKPETVVKLSKDESLQIISEKLADDEIEILAKAINSMGTFEKTIAINYLKTKIK